MTSYPLRIAAIDAGSNAIRHVVADFTGPTSWTVVDESRAPVRLGTGVEESGRLAPAVRAQAIRALAGIAARIRAAAPIAFRGVATSAVREARDGGSFLREVAAGTGLVVEAISGQEEARLVQLAISSRVWLESGAWVLIDLGGGSLEVTILENGAVQWRDSRPLGAVRLLETMRDAGIGPAAVRTRLDEYLSDSGLGARLRGIGGAGIIATGGNIEALLSTSHVRSGAGETPALSLRELGRLIGLLSELSEERRVSELGLGADRADVIFPAALVYERLADAAGADRIVVPRVGLKEGVLIDLARGLLREREE
jgi:exopolyphosphatase / guanosine-5'-triphosphate,3'-diphosphate pyrophosphatase